MILPHKKGVIDTDEYSVIKQVDGSYTVWHDDQEEPYILEVNPPSCTCPHYLWRQKNGHCQKHKMIVEVKELLGEVEEVVI